MQGPTPPNRPAPPVVPGVEKQQSSGADGTTQHVTGNENTDRQTGTIPAKADIGAAEGSVAAPKQTVEKGAPEFKTTIVEKTTAPPEKVTGQMPDSIPLLKGSQPPAADAGANNAGGDKPSANTSTAQSVAAQDAGSDGHGFFFYGVGILILAVLLFIVWELRKTNRQDVRRSEPEPPVVIPDSRSRTIIDYSADSRELVDLITGQEEFEPVLTKPKIAKAKPQQTVKSNFEIRV